jgi:hypothetical protein
LLLFYWGFLHQWSLRRLAFSSVFFWWVLVQYWDECNTGFIEWVRHHSFPFYFVEKSKQCKY